jgi:hypothetical protein
MGRRAELASIALAGCTVFAAAPRAGAAEAKLELAVPPRSADDPEVQTTPLREPDVDRGTELESRYEGVSAAGARATFGRTLTENVSDGWFGRFEMEAFTAFADRRAGPLAGVLLGGEIWLADDAVGGGLPMSFYFGFRTPTIFSSIGLGFDLFVYDDVEDDGGFGIYAPFGAASLGLDLGGVRILADGRAIYRWQWGAPDRGQLMLGLSLAHTIEERAAPRRARTSER